MDSLLLFLSVVICSDATITPSLVQQRFAASPPPRPPPPPPPSPSPATPHPTGSGIGRLEVT